MGRDLFNSPYGRFYNLAYLLSNSGHTVHIILLSHQKNETEKTVIGKLQITSISVIPNPFAALLNINSIMQESQPDWIFGFSDTYYGILAVHFANQYHCKSLIDAYDNYESYLPFLKPLHWMWRSSLKRATVVTCAGKSLKNLFRQYRKTKPIVILPMSADHDIFYQRPKEECRKILNFPLDVKLIGYHGSISESRDIRLLFSAAEIISSKRSDIKFVISGRKDKEINVPQKFLHKGYLSDSEVPILINSLDLLIVINKKTKFGNYSYPVKLYEAMSCNIPVVVSKTDSTEWIMEKYPQYLVTAEDENSLINKIYEVIDMEDVNYEKLPPWEEIADRLDKLIMSTN